MTPKQIVEDYIDAYNRLDLKKMLSLFDEDCIFENISNSATHTKCIGIQELESMANRSAKLFKSRQQTVINLVIEANKAAVQIDYKAVLASDLRNGLKAGQELNLVGTSFFEFESGKIKKLTDLS